MAHATYAHPGAGNHRGLWQVAQGLVLLITLALIAGFFLAPTASLNLLWNVLIPILPATFLIAPALWRGVCPLATLNMMPGRIGQRKLSAKALPVVGAVGILLLVVLVPARRFLFNEQAVALAVVVILVAVAALALGFFFGEKAGFCNAVCPVLPVEKLYGQHPLVAVGNPRCGTCTLCTPKGCLDLVPPKAALHAAGVSNGSRAWLRSVYGVFAAAFPGFIVGYYTTVNGPLATAGAVYLHVALWAAGSYALTALTVLLLKVPAARMLPVLAAAAVGLYYWYAGPLVAEALAVGAAGALVIRVLALGLTAVWLYRALGRTGGNGARRAMARPPALRPSSTSL